MFMGSQVRFRAVCLWLCVGVCLGVSFLLSLGIWHDSQPPGTGFSGSGRSLNEVGSLTLGMKKDSRSALSLLPRCRHLATGVNSSSLRFMRRFAGRKMVTYTSVYPSDGTKLRGGRRDTGGNEVIPFKVVSQLKLMYQSAQISRNMEVEFSQVEQTTLMSGLVIYFIQLNSSSLGPDPKHFVAIQNGALCCLSDFSVDLSRQVVVVATSMNLGEGWMLHFIKEFSEILEKTNEQNFKVILADFMSDNVDVHKLFGKSILHDRSKVISMNTTYNKPIGVEKAVSLIKNSDKSSWSCDLTQNPEDIVFLCDFHMEIPLDFFTLIRKHVITGHMVFAPVVAKLEKGSSPHDLKGVWDYNGFGMLGIARADWDVIGGINTRDFSDQWGGEDWDMIDRIVQHDLHVSRLRVPGLLHHYHSKTGMWPGGRLKLAEM